MNARPWRRSPLPPRWAGFALSVVLASTSTRDIHAEEVHLSYAAPSACPSESDFVAEVARRTSKASWVATRPDARSFSVTITPSESTMEGRLVIVDPRAPDEVSSRDVAGPSCREVVRALALITALAIDPNATIAPGPPPPSEPPPPPEPPAPPEPLELPPQPRLAASHPEPADPERPPRGEPWRWLVGTGALATSGAGDKLSLVVPAFVELTLVSTSWLAPSFRVGIEVLPDRRLTHPAGGGQLARIAGVLSGCPVKVALTPWLVLRPCGALEAGAWFARGEGVEDARASITPWLAAGAGARLQAFFTDWLLVEASGAATLALLRPRFVIDPNIAIDEVDTVAGQFGGSVGIRFP